jgi:hypothetical protein
MRLDTSGNLGLGVIPSAWSGGKAFQIGAYGGLSSINAGYVDLTANIYNNGSNFTYITTNPGLLYRLDVGATAF